jgi:hypothetical protein
MKRANKNMAIHYNEKSFSFLDRKANEFHGDFYYEYISNIYS